MPRIPDTYLSASYNDTVTSETRAVICGVNIDVRNITQRTATTNAERMFIVVSLPPGNYSIRRTRGFQQPS